MKLIIYTALFGDYDQLSKVCIEENVEYICFTDQKKIKAPGWKVILTELEFDDHVSKNRYIKFFPEKFLPSCDITVYIDSNIKIYKPIKNKIIESLGQNNIAIPAHPIRSNVDEEFSACIESGKISNEDANIVMRKYSLIDGIKKIQLTENNVIIRRYGIKSICNMQKIWWDEFLNGPKRDQLSLQYSSIIAGVDIVALNWNARELGSGLLAKPHKNGSIYDLIKYRVKLVLSILNIIK